MPDLTKMSVEELNRHTIRRIEGWQNMDSYTRAEVLKVLEEHSAELTRRVEVPTGCLKSSRGEILEIICVSDAGRAHAPGQRHDGEPMQNIRVVHRPAALAAQAKGVTG